MRKLNRAVPGSRLEMFAIEDCNYPGGWFYQFQYYPRMQVRYCATSLSNSLVKQSAKNVHRVII